MASTPVQGDRPYWLAWSQIPGLGSVLLQRLAERFGSLGEAWVQPLTEIGRVEGIGPSLLETIGATRPNIKPAIFLFHHMQHNPQFWTPADADYPRLLLESHSFPPVVYYQGVVDVAENQGLRPMVAIVGTRSPSEYGRRWTRKLTTILIQQGFTIVSGLAQGIDTEAHRTCIELGGRTIAVLGTGVDVVYPYRNRALYGQIQQVGLGISEYPTGTLPDRQHFPRRNRIIAGLCRAILVMEAPLQSGALITANLANEDGRDIYVLPGSLDNPSALGCLGLINKGAQVILGEDHLLEMLGAMPHYRPNLAEQLSLLTPPPPDLDPELQSILQIVSTDPLPFDVIIQKTQLSTATIASGLLQLELMGLITQIPGMRYQRC